MRLQAAVVEVRMLLKPEQGYHFVTTRRNITRSQSHDPSCRNKCSEWVYCQRWSMCVYPIMCRTRSAWEGGWWSGWPAAAVPWSQLPDVWAEMWVSTAALQSCTPCSSHSLCLLILYKLVSSLHSSDTNLCSSDSEQLMFHFQQKNVCKLSGVLFRW